MKNSLSNRTLEWTLGNPKDIIEVDDELMSPWDKLEAEKQRSANLQQIPEIMRNSIIQFPRRNIWICACDWPITRRDALNIFNKVRGVEIIKFPGTYTMVIAAGYRFNEEEVKNSIAKALKARPISVS
jgi:hypothetical protein